MDDGKLAIRQGDRPDSLLTNRRSLEQIEFASRRRPLLIPTGTKGPLPQAKTLHTGPEAIEATRCAIKCTLSRPPRSSCILGQLSHRRRPRRRRRRACKSLQISIRGYAEKERERGRKPTSAIYLVSVPFPHATASFVHFE